MAAAAVATKAEVAAGEKCEVICSWHRGPRRCPNGHPLKTLVYSSVPLYAYRVRTNCVLNLTHRLTYVEMTTDNLGYPLVTRQQQRIRYICVLSPGRFLLFGYCGLAALITVNNSAASLARAVTRTCSSLVLLRTMSSCNLAASRSANISKLFSLAVIFRSLAVFWID